MLIECLSWAALRWILRFAAACICPIYILVKERKKRDGVLASTPRLRSLMPVVEEPALREVVKLFVSSWRLTAIDQTDSERRFSSFNECDT